MIQTVLARRFPPAFWAPFGLLVADECHHVAAECFSGAMFGLGGLPRVLGLSATPRRRDGLTRVLTWFLGPVAFEAVREGGGNVEVRVVDYACERYRGPVPTNRRGDVCFTSIVSAIASDEDRTALVADRAAECAGAGREVLVLSHRRAHCEALWRALGARGVDAGLYLGGTREVPKTRVVVATFALTSEGFDEPRLNTLVLATPSSDVVQACGRVLRGGSGGSSAHAPLIVDVFDRWGPCYAQAARRRGYYRGAGFRVAGDSTQPPEPPEDSPPPPQTYAFVDV
jgi:superfamily II DNA or RNA helicase